MENMKYTDEYLKKVFANAGDSNWSIDYVISDAFYSAVRCVVYKGKASTSILQRYMSIGYGKAAKTIDLMEELGLVDGSYSLNGRNVLPEAKRFLEERNKDSYVEGAPIQAPNSISTGRVRMTGKEKCTILRNIRNEIAKANGIDFETTECTYEGECMGFCPKCDSEVRYLERELQRKAREGESIQLTGLAYPNFLEAVQAKQDEYEEIKRDKSAGERISEIMGDVWEVKGEKVLEMNIEELDLSVSSFNCLKRAGIDTVEDLINRTEEEMMGVKNLGRKSLEEVIQKLASLGLCLRKEDTSTNQETDSEERKEFMFGEFDEYDGDKEDLVLVDGMLDMEKDPLLEMTIEELGLDEKYCKEFLEKGILTVEDLITNSESDLKSKFISQYAIREAKEKLEHLGLMLKEELVMVCGMCTPPPTEELKNAIRNIYGEDDIVTDKDDNT